MKNFFIFLFIIATTSLGSAQSTGVPKTGANLTVEKPKIVLEKGSTYEFDLLLVRSKRARKAKFETPRIVGPKGLDFAIEADDTNSDLYKVIVNAQNMEPGKYFYLVSSKSNGIHKAKGLSMSFEVTESGSVASN